MQVPGGVLHVPEQQSLPAVQGAPGGLQQPQGMTALETHCCVALGQN